MSDVTLNQIFFSEAKGDGGQEGILGGPGEGLATLELDLRKQLPKIPFETIKKELMTQLGEVLNIGLEEILGSAWTKYQGIREYADPEKHPAEETALVPLADHTIESCHGPHVDLVVQDVMLGSIRLDVALMLTLEAVLLKIRGGKIRSIQGGSCQVSGSLTCSVQTKNMEKEILGLEKETPKLDLAVAIPLGDGIDIPTMKGLEGGSE